MYKFLLTIFAAATTLGASAFTIELKPIGDEAKTFPESSISAPLRSNSRAGSSVAMNYTPAGNPYSYTSLQNQKVGMKLAQAFEMAGDVVNKFAGNTMESIFFFTGVNMDESSQAPINTIKKATVFLTYTLEPFEPFYTQEVTLPADGLSLKTFNLDTPYTIESGKPVYVGYYYPLSSVNDNTLIFDAIDHGDDISGGWLGMQMPATTTDANPEWEFINVASQVGFLYLGAIISGDNLPTNYISCMGADTQPTVYENEEFSVKFMIQNDGADDINSFDVEVKVGDSEPQACGFSFNNQPLGYGKSAVATVSGLTYGTPGLERAPVTVTVTTVNEKPNNSQTASAATAIQVIPEGRGFDRNVVIEEFTGTWCQYCPQGIVTMEAIREAYPGGEVIPVAVHYKDQMASSSYVKISQTYTSTYPNAIINRQAYVEEIYPVESCFEQVEKYLTYPAPAKVTATAEFDSSKSSVIFHTLTSFSFDNEKASDDYYLAFAVTEDNVGPYTQINGFAGTDMSEWGDKPSNVSVLFNDVARQLNDGSDLQQSVPDVVEFGKEYDFSYTMKFLAATSISDKSNLNAIVYLINKHTGVIENACMIKNADLMASIKNVVADPDAPVEYFNLQGVRVAEPARGFYIRRQGSDSSIVAID